MMPVGSSLSAIGRPDIGLKVNSLLLILHVPLCWLLIPRYGISGAAIATTISLMIGVFIAIGLLPMLRTKLDFKWYGGAVGLAGAAIAIYWLGSKLMNHYIVGSLVLIAYAILILRVFLTKDDRAFIRSLISSVLTGIRK
jgi:O-antigen/teichoic acid export membrane protein